MSTSCLVQREVAMRCDKCNRIVEADEDERIVWCDDCAAKVQAAAERGESDRVLDSDDWMGR